MRLKFFHLVLLFYCTVRIHAQIIYTHQSSKNSYFISILEETGTENFLLTNNNISYNPGLAVSKGQILKISKTGQLLDSLNFSNTFLFTAPILAVNNYYYCYGTIIKTYGTNSESYFSTIYKIDQNLNIIQQAIIDTSYNDFISDTKVILKDNTLYLGNAHGGSGKIHFYKVDLNLVKKDSATNPGSILSDFVNYGDKLLAGGAGFDQGSVSGNNQVMELDTNFNVLSRFNLDNLKSVNSNCGSQNIGIVTTITNLYAISTDKYIVTGHYPVLDPITCQSKYQTISSVVLNNFFPLNTKIIGDSVKDNVIGPGTASGSMRYNSIYTTAMTGYNPQNPLPPQTNTTQILVHKIDTMGNILWVKFHKAPNMYYYPMGIYSTSDSGAVICGMRYNLLNPAVPNVCEGFVMKLDKNGNNTVVGLKENENPGEAFYKCYPNPANDKLYFEILSGQITDIKIYDVTGRKVQEINSYQNNSEISIAHLSKGLYTYKLSISAKIYFGKFIKE